MLLRVCGTAVVAGTLALTYLVVRASAQDAPTFRSSVQVIEVDATVTDARGKFVAGLTHGDFEVLEDGVPQAITSFALDAPAVAANRDTPDGAAASPSGNAPSAASAGLASAGAAAALLQRSDHVIILDSGTPARLQNVARSFIKSAVRPGDRVAIVEKSIGLPAELPFVDTREQMLRAIDNVSKIPCATTVESFWLIRDVVARLSRIQGSRKQIVFISNGTPLLWHGLLPHVQAADQIDGLRRAAGFIDGVATMQRAFEESMRMATVARIPVHTATPGGMRAPSVNVSSGTAPPRVESFDDPTGTQRSLAMATGSSEYFGLTPDQRVRAASDTAYGDGISMMRLVAEVTGGRDVVNTNAFDRNFRELAENRPVRYLLSYESAANQRDGRFHKIEVRVKRAGLKVRSRSGYYAFRPGGSITPAVQIPPAVSSQARALIEAERPIADVDASMHAASLSVGVPSATTLVAMQIANAASVFDASRPIEIVWTAASDEGYGALTAVERRMVNMATSMPGTALVAYDTLSLPEGTYRITAIASQEGGRTAMARTSVTVESRPSAPYGFTDVILASSRNEAAQIVHRNKEIMRLLPYPPAVRREFVRDSTLAFYTEFHDVSEWFDKVTMRLTVSSPRTGVKVRTDETMTFKKTNREAALTNPWMRIEGRRFSYANSLQLARFEPGAYTLKIEAIGSGERSATVSREVAFTVN